MENKDEKDRGNDGGIERADDEGREGKEGKVNLKRVKRKKTIAKRLRKMKMYFVNIRGIKNKMQSLKQIIEEENPDVVGIVETLLTENE